MLTSNSAEKTKRLPFGNFLRFYSRALQLRVIGRDEIDAYAISYTNIYSVYIDTSAPFCATNRIFLLPCLVEQTRFRRFFLHRTLCFKAKFWFVRWKFANLILSAILKKRINSPRPPPTFCQCYTTNCMDYSEVYVFSAYRWIPVKFEDLHIRWNKQRTKAKQRVLFAHSKAKPCNLRNEKWLQFVFI